ncbi:hypothetical protein ACFL1H_02805, partial [Nanoarchaeota archaeon]
MQSITFLRYKHKINMNNIKGIFHDYSTLYKEKLNLLIDKIQGKEVEKLPHYRLTDIMQQRKFDEIITDLEKRNVRRDYADILAIKGSVDWIKKPERNIFIDTLDILIDHEFEQRDIDMYCENYLGLKNNFKFNYLLSFYKLVKENEDNKFSSLKDLENFKMK